MREDLALEIFITKDMNGFKQHRGFAKVCIEVKWRAPVAVLWRFLYMQKIITLGNKIC